MSLTASQPAQQPRADKRTDRRGTQRRTRHLVPEPLSRRRDRRAEERRDSPRREVALDVREPGMKSRSCLGDLSVEGASYVTLAPPAGDVVQVMFSVPTYVGPIVATGTVVSRQGTEKGTQVGVAFTALDLEAQLAIAEWFDTTPRS
jgi:hypothetical protein